MAGCQETLAVDTPRKFPLCRAYSHLAAEAVGLALLSFGVPAQYLAQQNRSESAEDQFPIATTRRILLVHYCDNPTSNPNRLVSGSLLHFESLKRGRNVVSSDMV